MDSVPGCGRVFELCVCVTIDRTLAMPDLISNFTKSLAISLATLLLISLKLILFVVQNPILCLFLAIVWLGFL